MIYSRIRLFGKDTHLKKNFGAARVRPGRGEAKRIGEPDGPKHTILVGERHTVGADGARQDVTALWLAAREESHLADLLFMVARHLHSITSVLVAHRLRLERHLVGGLVEALQTYLRTCDDITSYL